MTDFCGQIRTDNTAQLAIFKVVFPDVPGRLIFIVQIEVLVNRTAHCEQDRRAVIGNLDVLDCVQTLRHLAGNVHRLGAD